LNGIRDFGEALVPKFDESEAEGRIGIFEVGSVVSKMNWIFREQPVPDTGIDGHIETRDETGNATGRLIGCQVKSGSSYFREETSSDFTYRGDSAHLAYWLGHSLPVIIILHNEETGKCYWQVVTDKTATNTPKAWKLEVPKAQVLGQSCKQQLELIADTGWLERSRTFATPAKFFGRVESNPLFDYDQSLQGRKNSLVELDGFLSDANATVAVLTGRGGIGKSKLIRHWSSSISEWTVLVKKETVPINVTTEQELKGDRYVLIVDDAHRHADLDALLQLVRDLRRDKKSVKILLSARPIGMHRIDAALSRSFDPGGVTRLSELKKLSDAEVRALAQEVLGPDHQILVPYLASVSRDTPLVTVIGGRLLRRHMVAPAELPSAEAFRQSVFDKFLDDFETVAQRSTKNIRPLLHVVSALQPLRLRDQGIVQSCATFLGWQDFEVSQAIDDLESSGLVTRTGRLYRIAPDMFADFLLEQACIGQDGTPNKYVDAVYRSFGNDYLSNLLQNVAELDLRVVTDSPQSSLLSDVWKDLRSKFEKADLYQKVQLLKSMQSAAFYQPGPAMELVRLSMEPTSAIQVTTSTDELFHYTHQDVLNALPVLLRAIAYQSSYRQEAIERLWELARSDGRRPNSYPEHALRILKTIASYSRYKPVSFNLEIAQIFRELCSEEDAFKRDPTPLDIIDTLLEREADEQESTGMTLVLSSFGLNYTVIAPVREVCFKTLEACLVSEDVAKACRSFRSLSELIHGFLPKYGRAVSEQEQKWHSEERKQCLALVAERLSAGDVPIPLAREIYAALEGFLARSQNEETTDRVRATLALIPYTGELASFDAFCTPDWDLRTETGSGPEISKSMELNRERSRRAAIAFRTQCETAERCIVGLQRFCRWARDANIQPQGANEFVHNLCDDPEILGTLAKQIREDNCSSELTFTAQVVLRRLRERNAPEYLETGLAAAKSVDLVVVRSAAFAMFGMLFDPATDDDLRIIDELASQSDWSVRRNVVHALSQIGRHPKREQDAIQRLLSILPGEDKKFANEICEVFVYGRIPIDHLSEEQLDRLYENFVPVADLDDHSIGMFLNREVRERPSAVIRFIDSRIKKALERRAAGDWKYTIVPPTHQNAVNLHELNDSDELSKFRTALLKHIDDQESLRDDLIGLFWRMTEFNENSFDLLRPLLQSKDVSKFDLAVRILRHAPGSSALSYPAQALEVLKAAEGFGSDHLEQTIGRLVANAYPNFIVTSANEEPPENANIRISVEKAVSNPQLDPLLTRLYNTIKAAAQVETRTPVLWDEEEEF
jgi:hypothetical protein